MINCDNFSGICSYNKFLIRKTDGNIMKSLLGNCRPITYMPSPVFFLR